MCRISIVNDDIVFSLLHTIQWSLSQPIHRDEEASLIWDRFHYEIGISHVMYEISIYIYVARTIKCYDFIQKT